jgi:hypothetical protein
VAVETLQAAVVVQAVIAAEQVFQLAALLP